MAFQNVNVSKFRKLTDLNVGETLEGYAVRIEESRTYEGQLNLVMRGDEGDYVLGSAGNLRYMLSDGKVKEGFKTRITRIADKVVKGKTSTQVEVLQDFDDSLSDASFAAITSVSDQQPAHQIPTSATAALKTANNNAIKQQAAKITQAIKNR